MNKSEFFKKKVKEFALLTNIQEDIVVRRDNRLGGYLAVIQLFLYSDTQEPVYLLKYNQKLFKGKTKLDLMNLVLHELGHIKYKHEFKSSKKYTTEKALSQMEYEAEKFAVLTIKKYYPRYLKKMIKSLKGYKDNPDNIYRKAFSRLAKEFDK